MKRPSSLYAPVGRRSAGSRWIGRIVALVVVLAALAGAVFAFLEFRDGRGGAWTAVQGWTRRAPVPAAAPEESAFGLVAPPPPEASPAEQVRHYRAEVERQPASWHAWQRLAVAAEAAGDMAEARRALVRVVQLQPRVQESWLALAQHHARQRNWVETEKAARRAAFTEGPRQMAAFVLLAGAVLIIDKPSSAENVSRLVAIVSGDPTLCVPLARAITVLGHVDISVPMLELALLQKMDGSAPALAEAYDRAGRAEDAARVRSSIKRYGQGV